MLRPSIFLVLQRPQPYQPPMHLNHELLYIYQHQPVQWPLYQLVHPILLQHRGPQVNQVQHQVHHHQEPHQTSQPPYRISLFTPNDSRTNLPIIPW